MDEKTIRVDTRFGREQLEIIVSSLTVLREEIAKTHDKATIPIIKELLTGQHQEVTDLQIFFDNYINVWDGIHGGDKDG